MGDTDIQNGYLVLADLSGFTRFVASSEVDHAGGILSNLLGMLREKLSPLLQLAEVEGDALFLYASADRLQRGETLLELIESTYVAFRERLQTMQRNATCPCHACRMIHHLDLKFVTHCGSFVLQDMNGSLKPFGSCVNAAHRLLKNDVAEATGWQAYALFTEHALDQMKVNPADTHVQRVSYPHLGEFDVHAIDLHDRHRTLTEERRAWVAPEDAHFTVQRRLALPAARLWELLNDPHLRHLWEMNADWSARSRPGGRTGPGAHNHCANSNFIEEVLDWHPFDTYTVRLRLGPVRIMVTGELKEDGEATELRWRMAMEGGVPRALRPAACRTFAKRLARIPERFQRLEQLINTPEFHESRGGHPAPAPAS